MSTAPPTASVATPASASSGAPQPARLVEETARGFITDLQRGYLADQASAVATLAQLRRGAGKLPSDIPDLWGLTGVDRLFAAEPLNGDERLAARAEAAYFVAVTLYALHQQSQSSPMHRRGVDLGSAVRQLMPDNGIDEPIRRRFVRVGTATTTDILAYRLREIISLLRGKGIPLDYGRLARQLYQAQTPDGLAQARREWGRGFHTRKADSDDAALSGSGASSDKDTE